MINRRRRFKQTVALNNRLQAFAQDLRRQALNLPLGIERSDLLKRARMADTACVMNDRLSPQVRQSSKKMAHV
jgi:hypothetical protein